MLFYYIYTDGACSGNPGPGAWAAIIFKKENNTTKKNIIFGKELYTTNNIMELKAIINALENLDINSKIYIYTDSMYAINGITKWIKNWSSNDWKTSKNNKIKNQDLWKKLQKLSTKFNIRWNHVKGHSGNKYNEEVNEIARSNI